MKATAEQRAAATGVCQTNLIDKGKVAAVRAVLPAEDRWHASAEFFTALGDLTRLRLLFALSHAELCVCDLASLVDRSMPTTSRQLQHLRRVGLVKFRSEGKLVYYSLADRSVDSLIREALARSEPK